MATLVEYESSKETLWMKRRIWMRRGMDCLLVLAECITATVLLYPASLFEKHHASFWVTLFRQLSILTTLRLFEFFLQFSTHQHTQLWCPCLDNTFSNEFSDEKKDPSDNFVWTLQDENRMVLLRISGANSIRFSPIDGLKIARYNAVEWLEFSSFRPINEEMEPKSRMWRILWQISVAMQVHDAAVIILEAHHLFRTFCQRENRDTKFQAIASLFTLLGYTRMSQKLMYTFYFCSPHFKTQ